MAQNNDTELSVVCLKVAVDVMVILNVNWVIVGHMMRQDIVKLGRVINEARYSHTHDCIGGALVGIEDIGRRDNCAVEIAQSKLDGGGEAQVAKYVDQCPMMTTRARADLVLFRE